MQFYECTLFYFCQSFIMLSHTIVLPRSCFLYIYFLAKYYETDAMPYCMELVFTTVTGAIQIKFIISITMASDCCACKTHKPQCKALSLSTISGFCQMHTFTLFHLQVFIVFMYIQTIKSVLK